MFKALLRVVDSLWVHDSNTPQWVTEVPRQVLSIKARRCSFQTCTNLYAEPIAENAVNVGRVHRRNEYSWTALISKYTKCGQGRQALRVYDEMRKDGVKPSSHTFVALLKACSSLHDLETAKQIHAEVARTGFESDLYVGTMLVDVYAKCRSLVDARRAFEKMPRRDVVSWTAMIFGYAQTDEGEEALELFTRMQREGVVPNDRTFVSALKACSSLAESEEGQQGDKILMKERCLETVRSIHAHVKKERFDLDVFVGTMLVDVYAKCGSLDDAKRVFEDMPRRTVVSWNAMILGYAQRNEGTAALQLYTRMRQEGVAPDDRTYVSVLKACSSLVELEDENDVDASGVKRYCLATVKALHRDIANGVFESDVFVGTMLVAVYAKCGSLEDARHVFEKMPRRTVVSWNAMILAYAQMDQGELALQVYSRMQEEGVAPDERTYVGALNACGCVAGLEKGKEIHAQILRGCPEAIDPFVANSLIDMYGKCGSMVDAQQVFDAMPRRGIVAWSTLIAGYAHQGESELVFHLFERMKEEGIEPNSFTFLSVLTVCSHVGLVDRGQKYFETMTRDYGIAPRIEHYTSVVDLIGRSGEVDKAMEMVKAMPCLPDSAVWECILCACRKWGNIELARQAFDHALRLDENAAAPYVMMSNIYAAAHMREEALEIQAMRLKSRAWKQPGRSRWTDMSGSTHVFLVGDRGHPESRDILALLGDLLMKMEKEGYIPHLVSMLSQQPDYEDSSLFGYNENLVCE